MIGAARCRWLLILPILAALSWAGCGRRPSPEAQEPAEVAEVAPQQELAERVIPVFCYHDMSASPTGRFEVATEDFRQHLQLLHDEGFESVTASQLAGYYEGKVELPQKAVALTFDDGPRSILTESKPLMDKHGFVGTAFLITESVGGKGQLTWEDVAALEEAGWGVGSHTVSHVDPTKVSAEELAEEFTASRAAIEEHIPSEVVALAYPYGNYDEQVMRQAQEAGYRVAFSIDRGPADNTDDPMRLPREMVVKGNSMKTFKRWVRQEKLHFADPDPPIGQRVETTSPTFTVRVADEAIPLSDIELTVEDKPPERQTDEAKRTITFAPELAKGANIVRANYWGSPQREVSWIVVCEAE